jgi:hypothetical protein
MTKLEYCLLGAIIGTAILLGWWIVIGDIQHGRGY